jgi:hypothetical protein
MKQLFLLSLLLLFASAAFSQGKFEFGFVVKAGTFTLPHQIKSVPVYTYDYPVGFSSSYGVFVSRRLGAHFRLSLDLLYNFSMYEEIGKGSGLSPSLLPIASFGRYRNMVAHSLIAPLQVNFTPKSSGKLVLSAGVALNCVVGSAMRTEFEENSLTFGIAPLSQRDVIKRFNGERLFQRFFTFGIAYKVSPETSIGADFTGLLRHTAQYPFEARFCNCFDIDPTPFWMQSLAISLRHNILR